MTEQERPLDVRIVALLQVMHTRSSWTHLEVCIAAGVVSQASSAVLKILRLK